MQFSHIIKFLAGIRTYMYVHSKHDNLNESDNTFPGFILFWESVVNQEWSCRSVIIM